MIIFRDLKPTNIGFDSSGTVKLFDFGFAVNLTSMIVTTTPSHIGRYLFYISNRRELYWGSHTVVLDLVAFLDFESRFN